MPADWVVRLGDGTDESRRRIEAALPRLWLYSAELFEADAVDEHAADTGLGPRWAELREPWLAEMAAVLDEAGIDDAEGLGLPQHRQARRAQRAHGLHPGRDAAPAACLSRRRVVRAVVQVQADSRTARAWEVLATVLDPEVPALSVCDLGIVRDVQSTGATNWRSC